ncbi:MAG: DMT family transporter [Paracoccaceae bacterium]
MNPARLFALTALAMAAFAANSVLNRLAVGGGWIAPLDFSLVRVVAGAAMLVLLMLVRRGALWAGWRGRGAGAFGLVVYLVGFSLAYQVLGAGIGALILFGSVQVTMFAGAIASREVMPPRRWLGASLAFAGLVLLVAPGGTDVAMQGAVAMALAGIGWGIYSLAGRGAQDALGATAWNFVLAMPVLVAVVLIAERSEVVARPWGILLAVLSGAVTSGLGYALWYAVVPTLGAARAAVAQLTVPMLAALGGAVLIGEGIGWRFLLASALILGGVGLASFQSGLTRR